jgi:hypothetical protein
MSLTFLRHATPAVGAEICYGAREAGLAPGVAAEAMDVLGRLGPVG